MEYKLVSVADSALDLEAMTADECRAFMLDREEKHAKFVAGVKPTWFHCSDYPLSAWRSYVAHGASEYERNARAFQVGVKSVDNFVSQQGKSYAQALSGTETLRTSAGELPMWSEAEMDLFSPVVVEDIGSVILQRSTLPFGSVRRLRVPPLSLLILGQRATFLAAAPEAKPPQSSSKSSRPTKSARPGAKRTAARATE